MRFGYGWLAAGSCLALTACQPEVKIEAVPMHGSHAGERVPDRQRAMVYGKPGALVVRGEIQVAGLCPVTDAHVERRRREIYLHVNVSAGESSCIDFHRDAGVSYSATISPLRAGVYTVFVDHALAAPVGLDTPARRRLDHYKLGPVRIRVR